MDEDLQYQVPQDPYKQYLRYVSDQRVLKTRWAAHGACVVVGPGAMYPVKIKEQFEAAEQYCFDCPVAIECLKISLLGCETEGVWGGTTEPERKILLDLTYDLINPRQSWDDSMAEIISDIAVNYVTGKRVARTEVAVEL